MYGRYAKDSFLLDLQDARILRRVIELQRVVTLRAALAREQLGQVIGAVLAH